MVSTTLRLWMGMTPRALAALLVSIVLYMSVVSSQGAAAPATGWINTGPPGASIDDLAVSPSQPSTVYAASTDNVYRSDNAGGSWVETDPGLLGYTATVAVAPQDPDVVYAGDL